MNDLIEKTKTCVELLTEVEAEPSSASSYAKDSRFGDWLQAVYNEPNFLYFEEDYFAIYEEIQGKEISRLPIHYVRAGITFMIQQIRHGYDPYHCMRNGELKGFLQRWMSLTEKNMSGTSI